MESYTKLYQRILQSSVWKCSSDVRIVWITLLALKDGDGMVKGTAGWLADQARVSDEVCEEALRIFSSPDARSRTGDNEGRKIKAVEGGWVILNHLLYRDGMEETREKWRRQKQAQRQKVNWPRESIQEKVKQAVEEDPQTIKDRQVFEAKWGVVATVVPNEDVPAA